MSSKTSIPWWVYVFVGVFVSLYSSFIRSRDPSNASMTFFFYVGLLFILFGLGKVAFLRVSRSNSSGEKRSYSADLSRQDRLLKAKYEQRSQHPAQYNIISCPRCGARHYSYSNFCSRCGARLK